MRAYLTTDDNDEIGDSQEEIEDFFDDAVLPLEQAVLALGLRRRPQLMNMKRIRVLSLPRIKLSMKNIQVFFVQVHINVMHFDLLHTQTRKPFTNEGDCTTGKNCHH